MYRVVRSDTERKGNTEPELELDDRKLAFRILYIDLASLFRGVERSYILMEHVEYSSVVIRREQS